MVFKCSNSDRKMDMFKELRLNLVASALKNENGGIISADFGQRVTHKPQETDMSKIPLK